MSATPLITNTSPDIALLSQRYQTIRDTSIALIDSLSAEDACVQSMPDCSPAKWHLAHTTWFFETFLLEPRAPYQCFHPQFKVLFNSYYNAVGEQHPRPARGMLTRPSLDEVIAYREHVDREMRRLIDSNPDEAAQRIIEVGLHHEQQHQELLLMDIKHLLAQNPLRPCYKNAPQIEVSESAELTWLELPEAVVDIGARDDGFCFDNEKPLHKHFLAAYKLANRLVTNGEYRDFVDAGGYEDPRWWLSDGWATIQQQAWQAPLYWRKNRDDNKTWFEFTLHGEHELKLDAPVVHLSFYEADAYARWAGARLSTEMEWEHAVRNFADSPTELSTPLLQRTLHPQPARQATDALKQIYTDVWQWTASAYLPYPGYVTPPGAIGEYNGKFMSNQMVLKGACCVTPEEHSRASYRNFFYPHCRWQFAGIRLAK